MQMGQYLWEMRNLSKILVGKSERRKPVSRPRGRWMIDVKMKLKMKQG
jgi:hypothetical protein